MKPEHVRILSAHTAQVWVPKVGWVRFRMSRPVPPDTKSYRIARDAAGRWHIAFAHIPSAIPASGNGQMVGVDRGVVVSAALSTGQLLKVPGLSAGELRRFTCVQRKLSRAKRGSNRRGSLRQSLAKLHARAADRRKNWVEQTSTCLARAHDVIGVENLNIRAMTRCAAGSVE